VNIAEDIWAPLCCF